MAVIAWRNRLRSRILALELKHRKDGHAEAHEEENHPGHPLSTDDACVNISARELRLCLRRSSIDGHGNPSDHDKGATQLENRGFLAQDHTSENKIEDEKEREYATEQEERTKGERGRLQAVGGSIDRQSREPHPKAVVNEAVSLYDHGESDASSSDEGEEDSEKNCDPHLIGHGGRSR